MWILVEALFETPPRVMLVLEVDKADLPDEFIDSPLTIANFPQWEARLRKGRPIFRPFAIAANSGASRDRFCEERYFCTYNEAMRPHFGTRCHKTTVAALRHIFRCAYIYASRDVDEVDVERSRSNRTLVHASPAGPEDPNSIQHQLRKPVNWSTIEIAMYIDYDEMTTQGHWVGVQAEHHNIPTLLTIAFSSFYLY